MTTSNDRKNIVIIGGGIIGACTAYFLTRHPSFDPTKHTITLLEASPRIAGGASGKAGGLLALWAYPSNLVPLSFRLHAELAKEHGGAEKWGYRRVGVGQLEARGRLPVRSINQSNGNGNGVDGGKNGTNTETNQDKEAEATSLQKRTQQALSTLRAAGLPSDLDWLSPDAVTGYEAMASDGETAQVHPYHFTTSMAALAQEKGVQIKLGARVTRINPSASGEARPPVESVTYVTSSSTSSSSSSTTPDDDDNETKTLPATHVVLAAGPWTSHLLPSSKISGLRAHSVTIRPSRPISAYALFTHITLPASTSPSQHKSRTTTATTKTVTPEIYARPFNEVYACGEGDTLVPLPLTTADVETDPARCQDIVDHVGSISDELRDGEVTARQACYLPVCDEGGGPWIGEVREMKGLVLASGHSCWGIQNGPATGLVVGEIVLEGRARSVRLGGLDPLKGL